MASPSHNETFAQGNTKLLNSNVKVEVISQLNQEQAKELLKMHNPNIDYIYQGNQEDFEALKKQGLKGYVFLPDVETDLGFFVDENSGSVYYFHPSGYMELAF